jgi:drug/metabolite transporter (DMT)-like permease
LLAAPFTTLFLLFRLGFEPSLGSLPSLLQVSESQLGSFIVFGVFLLLLAAFFGSGYSLIQSKKAGKRLPDDPINLLLALATLLVIILVIGSIIVDQHPCWIGVPNCD